MPETHDAVIVGGGVIGCAIAHLLAARGVNVLLLDAGQRLGFGASDAAMGGIHVQTEPDCLGSVAPLVERSRHLYGRWLSEIGELSGAPVHLIAEGCVQVALGETEMERLQRDALPVWQSRPFSVERLSADEVRSLEPLLTGDVAGGFLFPDEPALDPRELMRSLDGALRAASARVVAGARVTRVMSSPSGATVELHDGSRMPAAVVVVAAGHLSGALLPGRLPRLFPIKGVAFDARPPEPLARPLRHHIYAEIDGAHPYLVPRADGRVAMGVTYEEGAGDVTVTAEEVEEIRRGVGALMPSVLTWPMHRRWAGLRPGTADRLPVVGHVDEHRRIIAATGHAGLGITLAPVTAELVSALVLGTGHDVRELLAICRPDRSPAPAGSG